jgi:tetratricopeptide (TPR) repeat protein
MTKKRLLAKVLSRSGNPASAGGRPDPVAAGYSFFRQGNYQEALKTWENAAPPPAAVGEAFFRLGLQHQAAGHARAALTAWQKAVRTRPDQAAYHFHCGLGYYRQNDPAAAAASFRLALELRPGDPRILFHLGLAVAAAALAGDRLPPLNDWLEGEGAGLAPPQKDFLKAVARYTAGEEVPPAPPGRPSLAATHLVRALASSPEAAKAHIGQALDLDPQNAAAWRLSSLVLAALGDPEADRTLEQACALGNRRDQLVARATELKKGILNDMARRGDLAAAVSLLSREGKTSPVDPGRKKTALLLTRRGDDLARREEWEQAAECWRLAREAGAGDPRLLHNLALTAELLGRPAAAAGYWRRTIDAWTAGQGPGDAGSNARLATAYRHLAELEAGEGHYEAYVTDLELAARYAPQDAQIRLDLARAFMSAEEDAKCLSVLEEALRLAPENPEVICGLAVMYGQRREWEKAGPLLTRGLAVAPDDPHLRMSMRDYYMHMAFEKGRNYADTVQWLTRAAEVATDPMPVLVHLAVFAFVNNRRADWYKYRDEAMSLHPGNPSPCFRLAQLFMGTRRPAMGRKYLKKALALTSGDAEAYLRAADICLDAGLSNDADRYLRKALDISPALHVYQEAAELCHDHEQWELALPILAEAREAFPDDPEILIYQVETLISLRRYGEALDAAGRGGESVARDAGPDAVRVFRMLKRFLEEEIFE